MIVQFTPRAQQVLSLAGDITQRAGGSHITDLALLIAILEQDSGIAATILKELGLELQRLYKEFHENLKSQPAHDSTGSLLAPDARHVIQLASEIAARMQATEVGTEHLLLAMIRASTSHAGRTLARARITESIVQAAAIRLSCADSNASRGDAAAESARSRVREILLNDWDPHNAARFPEAARTYDTYINPLIELLRSSVDEEPIMRWLHDREKESMCFPALGTERLRRVARKLLALGIR